MTTAAPSAPALGRSASHASFFPRDDDEGGTPSAALASISLDGAPREPQRCGAASRQQPSEPQPQAGAGAGQKENDVGALVAKAKKAASSLWTILHAQNCRQPQCPHRGCADTRLLLAHVKSCPAGPSFPCPAHCRGCHEARKLLAHYRRCKEARTKRVGHGRRNGLRPEQSCLVCSLMARYAKGVADRSLGKAGTSPVDVASVLSSSAEGRFKVCPAVEGGARGSDDDDDGPGLPRRTSFQLMPPPPRRRPQLQASSSNESFGSPPEPSHLLRSGIATVAAIADPSRSVGSTLSDPSLLGRSVDSTVRVPFPVLRRGPSEEAIGDEEELVIPGMTHPSRRRRAGSCDERRASAAEGAPNGEGDIGSPARPRSVSCGSHTRGQHVGKHPSPMSSSVSGCETIAEEDCGAEPPFQMD